MSDTLSKRQISEVSDTAASQTKRAETALAESKKATSKPGRKPLETEPKNKRTAQNRAAQRAFRERKERKMKELEEKIEVLEDEKKSATTESEFLRLQVETLMAELAKHRGTSDFSDLNLPAFKKESIDTRALSQTPSGSDSSSVFSPQGSDDTLKSLSSIVTGSEPQPKPQFAFEFPWSRKSSVQLNSSSSNRSSSSNNVPALSSDASTTSSSESSPFELYNQDETNELPRFNRKTQKANEQEFNFDENFNEGVSEFCNDLGTACGTKDAPVPRSKSAAATPVEPAQTLTLDLDINSKQTEDPLAFLRDPTVDYNFASFDPSLAFSGDNNMNLFESTNDPIADLTTEESMYDPFGMFQQRRTSTQKNSTKIDHLLGTGDVESEAVYITNAPNDEGEVVPSRDGRLLKCTEIWDRITSHPKYADIDIDGLCSELRAKAKCSDKGVVIDYSDVNKVIMNSLPASD